MAENTKDQPKLTPGPWHTGGTFNPGTPEATQHIWGPTPTGKQSGKIIAEHASIPNARLIAAAPDMYAALEAIQWGQVELGTDGEAYYLCPECDRSEVRGHQADCSVGLALAKAMGAA